MKIERVSESTPILYIKPGWSDEEEPCFEWNGDTYFLSDFMLSRTITGGERMMYTLATSAFSAIGISLNESEYTLSVYYITW